MRTLKTLLVAGSLLASPFLSATSLNDIVESRPVEMQQRDQYRNPAETLTFFGIKPGMTVAEALPGGGWYTQIIAPAVGSKGMIYGINYNDDMWARFGFFSEERIKEQIALTSQFPQMVADFGDAMPAAQGFTFATVPDNAKGKVDRLLFIRALHNLNRFETEAGTMTNALKAAHALLTDDGMVGVVQHRAPENSGDDWANGSNGYLKQSQVIAAFEAAGFALVGESDVNANPKDQPTESDMVWRLPPTYFGSNDDEDKKAAMTAIGESDRMTLLFKKAS